MVGFVSWFVQARDSEAAAARLCDWAVARGAPEPGASGLAVVVRRGQRAAAPSLADALAVPSASP